MKMWKKFACLTALLLMLAGMASIVGAADIGNAKVIEGDGGTYIKGSNAGYSITFESDTSFTKLLVDDKKITDFKIKQEVPPTETPTTMTPPTNTPTPETSLPPTETPTETVVTDTPTIPIPSEDPTASATPSPSPSVEPSPIVTEQPSVEPSASATPSTSPSLPPTENFLSLAANNLTDTTIKTDIEINSAYLDTLDVGSHVITGVFEDNSSAVAKITVAKENSDPTDDSNDQKNNKNDDQKTNSGTKTGDSSMPITALLILAAFSGAVTLYFGVKKKYN